MFVKFSWILLVWAQLAYSEISCGYFSHWCEPISECINDRSHPNHRDCQLIEEALTSGYWDQGLYISSRLGNMELFDFFVRQGANGWNHALGFALENPEPNMDIVNFLMSEDITDQKSAILGAAMGGRQNWVDFLLEKMDQQYFNKIDSGYRLGEYRFEHNEFRHRLLDTLMQRSASRGHLDLVKHLHQLGADEFYHSTYEAAENGHNHVIEYLLPLGYNRYEKYVYKSMLFYSLRGACINGHIETAKMFLDLVDDPDSLMNCKSLARDKGHYDMIYNL